MGHSRSNQTALWDPIGGRILTHFAVQPLRLCERPGRDGCQSTLWDCFGGRIFSMAANSSHKTVPECTLTAILTRSLAKPQSGV